MSSCHGSLPIRLRGIASGLCSKRDGLVFETASYFVARPRAVSIISSPPIKVLGFSKIWLTRRYPSWLRRAISWKIYCPLSL